MALTRSCLPVISPVAIRTSFAIAYIVHSIGVAIPNWRLHERADNAQLQPLRVAILQLPSTYQPARAMEQFLREWRQDAFNKHQYESAIFVGDKLLALTGEFRIQHDVSLKLRWLTEHIR